MVKDQVLHRMGIFTIFSNLLEPSHCNAFGSTMKENVLKMRGKMIAESKKEHTDNLLLLIVVIFFFHIRMYIQQKNKVDDPAI